jgi:hypothetical protein
MSENEPVRSSALEHSELLDYQRLFVSQYDPRIPENFRPVACAVAALTMALKQSNPQNPNLSNPGWVLRQMFQTEVQHPYLHGKGWGHEALQALFHKLHYNAFFYYPEQEGDLSAYFELADVVRVSGAVLVSFQRSTGGHMMIVSSILGDTVTILDPEAKSAKQGVQQLSSTDFLLRWKGNYIAPTMISGCKSDDTQMGANAGRFDDSARRFFLWQEYTAPESQIDPGQPLVP